MFNVRIFVILVGGLLPGETSGATRVQEELMETFAPILETPGTTKEVEASMPSHETVIIEKVK